MDVLGKLNRYAKPFCDFYRKHGTGHCAYVELESVGILEVLRICGNTETGLIRMS